MSERTENDAACRECPCQPDSHGGYGVCECECHWDDPDARVIPPDAGHR